MEALLENKKTLEGIFGNEENIKVEYDQDHNQYEVVFTDVENEGGIDEHFFLSTLQNLNKAGFIYLGSQGMIDYEDESPEDIKYMDIIYLRHVAYYSIF